LGYVFTGLILILTYHRVLRQPHAKPKFHDVSAEAFERQVEALAHHDFHPLTPDELLDWKPRPKPAFILTFDDGTEDHFEIVLPILARKQWRGIFFVPTAELNRPGYVDNERVKAMSRAGHYIGLHSHEHRPMTRMSPAEARDQMKRSRGILEQLTGSPQRIFAPPGGYISRAILDAAIESGVSVIRTMRWGYNRKMDLLNLQCVPMHRAMTEKDFAHVLQFRGPNLTYAFKEILKRMLPEKAYNSLRDRIQKPE
jgi:peptidoglycan/xylan/chitin deacetylase (PgdA/CDA1 family)